MPKVEDNILLQDEAVELEVIELERQYREILGPGLDNNDGYKNACDSLEQPSPLKVVDTVTTYGAYEDPIS